MTSETPNVSRRSVVQVAAWTAPAVAVAVAAPLAAASETLDLVAPNPVYRGQKFGALQVSTSLPSTSVSLTSSGVPSTGLPGSVTTAGGTASVTTIVAGDTAGTITVNGTTPGGAAATTTLTVLDYPAGQGRPNSLDGVRSNAGPGQTGQARVRFNVTQNNLPTTLVFKLDNPSFGFLMPDGSYDQVVVVQTTANSVSGVLTPEVHWIGPGTGSTVMTVLGVLFGNTVTLTEPISYHP